MSIRMNDDGSATVDLKGMPTFCNGCDDLIPAGKSVQVFQSFAEPVAVPPVLEGICEPIVGVWVEYHAKCVPDGAQTRS